MRLSHFQNFSTSRVKALFGFHPKILGEILTRLLPELEHQRGCLIVGTGSVRIVAAMVTTNDFSDGQVLPDLLVQIPSPT